MGGNRAEKGKFALVRVINTAEMQRREELGCAGIAGLITSRNTDCQLRIFSFPSHFTANFKTDLGFLLNLRVVAELCLTQHSNE